MASNRAERAPVSDSAEHTDRLVEAVRALIREELGRPALPEAPSLHPSWREAFWLLVFCGNVILILSRLPRNLFSGPGVELAVKLLPALLGSLFVIYLAWFRERLLAISRMRRFHGLQLALLALLIFLNLRVVPVQPIIRPQGAGLVIDGRPQKQGHGIRVEFGGHDITLLPPASEDKLEAARRSKERKFRFGLLQLLVSVFGPQRPDWGLLTQVYIPVEPDWKLRIQKVSGDFYEDVVERTNMSLRDRSTLEMEMEGDISKQIMLPIGKYEVTAVLASGKDCKAESLLEVEYGMATEFKGLERCR